MRNSSILFLGLILIIIIGGVVYWSQHAGTMQAPSATAVSSAVFSCDAGKSITASFFNTALAGSSTAATANPSQPPKPVGYVHLVLSDGRSMSLPQTVSADGARYSNGDPQVQGSETMVFWEKGNGALVLENNQQQTYTGCVVEAADPGGLPQVYSNGTAGYSFRYPAGYTLDASSTYQALGPGKTIYGTKVTIPASVAQGTNLSSDTYLSVEQLPSAQACDAALFLGDVVSTSTVTDAGTTYSYAKGSDAGAGNLYEEDVYALPGTNPCTAVRYFIHSTQLGNYPAGTVAAFDEGALTAQFDAIRRTLTLAQ